MSDWVIPSIICLFHYFLGSYEAAKAGFACSAILCQHGFHALQHVTMTIVGDSIMCTAAATRFLVAWTVPSLCYCDQVDYFAMWDQPSVLNFVESACLAMRSSLFDYKNLQFRCKFGRTGSITQSRLSAYNTTCLRSSQWHVTQLCKLWYPWQRISET